MLLLVYYVNSLLIVINDNLNITILSLFPILYPFYDVLDVKVIFALVRMTTNEDSYH